MPEHDRVSELEREVARLKAESAEKTRCLMRMGERLTKAATEEAKVPGLERQVESLGKDYRGAIEILKVLVRDRGGRVDISPPQILDVDEYFIETWRDEETQSVVVKVFYDPIDLLLEGDL